MGRSGCCCWGVVLWLVEVDLKDRVVGRKGVLGESLGRSEGNLGLRREVLGIILGGLEACRGERVPSTMGVK